MSNNSQLFSIRTRKEERNPEHKTNGEMWMARLSFMFIPSNFVALTKINGNRIHQSTTAAIL